MMGFHTKVEKKDKKRMLRTIHNHLAWAPTEASEGSVIGAELCVCAAARAALASAAAALAWASSSSACRSQMDK